MPLSEEIVYIKNEFQNSFKIAQYFQAAIYRSMHLSSILTYELTIDTSLKKNLSGKSEIVDSLEMFNKWMSKFGSAQEFDKVIIEKTFVDKFQVFETLLFDLISTLYKNYPKFLSKNENSINIPIDDLYSKSDIEDLRTVVVEYKTKQIIQSNSIVLTVQQVEKIFGVDLKIDNTVLKEVYLISRLRNLVIHNKSKINDLVLNELRKQKITIELKTGEDIIEYIKHNEEKFEKTLWSIGNIIVTQIGDSVDQITKYHEALL